jgi:hypothetical protein
MNWDGLKIAGLLTFGAAMIGTTVVQLAAGTLKPRYAGARFTAGLGAILGGFAFLPELASVSRWLIGAGCLCIIASSIQGLRNRARVPGQERKPLV